MDERRRPSSDRKVSHCDHPCATHKSHTHQITSRARTSHEPGPHSIDLSGTRPNAETGQSTTGWTTIYRLVRDHRHLKMATSGQVGAAWRDKPAKPFAPDPSHACPECLVRAIWPHCNPSTPFSMLPISCITVRDHSFCRQQVMGSAREPRVGRQRLAARWATLFNEASNAPGMAQWGRRRDERFGAASAVNIAVRTLWHCPKSIGSRGTLRGPGPNPAAPPLSGRFLGRPRHRDHRHRHLCRRDAAARSGPVLAPFLRALLLSGIGSHSRALHALVLTFGAPARLHAWLDRAGRFCSTIWSFTLYVLRQTVLHSCRGVGGRTARVRSF